MEFGVGSILDGKVTGITKFGAFVALPEGRSGLVHISEIAYSYVNEVSDYLKGGAGGQGQGHWDRSDQPDQFVHQKVNDPLSGPKAAFRAAVRPVREGRPAPVAVPAQAAHVPADLRPGLQPRSRRTLRTVSASSCRHPTASSLSSVIWRRRAGTARAAVAAPDWTDPFQGRGALPHGLCPHIGSQHKSAP